MRASDPTDEKYKKVCKDFPNLAILTKRATPGEVQLTFGSNVDGDKIRLPIAEVLLCTAAGDLTRSKKQRDWLRLVK